MMEMLIISSEQQMRLIMLFSRNLAKQSDKALIKGLDAHPVTSSAYPAFKAATDLRVERITLPVGDDKNAALEGGDFLYRYLAKGYICLGEHKGDPKPNLAAWGVRSIRKLPKVGFGL